MPNRLKEILDTPVTPREIIAEARHVAHATMIGILDGIQFLDKKDPASNVADAALIPLRRFFGASRDSLGRLFGKPEAPKG
jgi:hypothetical protein